MVVLGGGLVSYERGTPVLPQLHMVIDNVMETAIKVKIPAEGS